MSSFVLVFFSSFFHLENRVGFFFVFFLTQYPGILRFPIDFQQLAEDELGGDDDSDWDPEDFM